MMLSLLITCQVFAHQPQENLSFEYLKKLVLPDSGIGVREAGSIGEQKLAKFISNELKKFGYKVTLQSFDFKIKELQLSSNNIVVETGDATLPTIVVGAHYDSTAKDKGSFGAIDNGTGVAAMLEIASLLIKNPPTDFNIRFIAFGAEEVGLIGSKHYVNSLKPEEVANIVGMINFDTIAGGDFVYVHSANSIPYRCVKSDLPYSKSTILRNAVVLASQNQDDKQSQYIVHSESKAYPKGETGPWSDHYAFACAGIPIAYVESTNFSINGEAGFDGYSQTINPLLWDCFDVKTQGACHRESEKKWGKIWHTQYDQLTVLETQYPNRIKKQLSNTVKTMSKFLLEPKKYLFH